MKKVNPYISFLFALVILASCGKKQQSKMTPEEVQNMVAEAYVHCFPIVENYKAMYFYGILKESPKYTPINTVVSTTRLYTPDDKFVVTPNNDTYYTIGILDLRAEPILLEVPKIEDNRYYSFQLVSMNTDNFGYIGTRATGNDAGKYVITSPSYQGKLPADVKEIKAPSEFVIIIGRTQVNEEDPKDREIAKKIVEQYQLGVLSKFYPEFKPKTVEAINFPTYSDDVLTSTKFFERLNFLLPFLKPSTDEQSILDKYEVIGVKAGIPYNFVENNPQYKEAVDAGIKEGLQKVDSIGKKMGLITNGWLNLPIIEPFFGTAYDIRAGVARVGIYANDPIEAHYPMSHVDKDGQQLNGQNTYTLTFPAGKLPPVKYFWSLTMYDNTTRLLVANPINRYSVGDRTKGLKYGKDGSLTIYMSYKQPKEGTSNWLPAPEGDFNLAMRLYGPKDNVLKGTWLPEPIIKINK